MRQAKDDEGRNWQIVMNAAAAIRVQDLVTVTVQRETTGPDGTTTTATTTEPFAITDISRISETLTILKTGFVAGAETLWAVVKPQADDKGISRESFLETLSGDALERMTSALVDELIDFFPTPHRAMLRTLRTKLDEVAGALVDNAQARIESLDTASALRIATIEPVAVASDANT